jgi:hypothetical protein
VSCCFGHFQAFSAEADLLDHVRQLCRDASDIPVEVALREIKENGVKPLSSTLEAMLNGVMPKKALLSRNVFMSLVRRHTALGCPVAASSWLTPFAACAAQYTLGTKAKDSFRGDNFDTMYQFHTKEIQAWLVGGTDRGRALF